MRTDFILFFSIFVFIFIIWLYTGGPTHPISFAGPYLTPVTNVGGESEAYGSTSTLSGSGGSFWSSWTSGWTGASSNETDSSDVPVANRSPFAGKVHIESGSSGPAASDVKQEYVALRASNDSGTVNITGWSLASPRTGTIAVIRTGELIAKFSSQAPIVLNSGDEAIISSRSSPIDTSFKETTCTGYLDSTSYEPSLSTNSCPAPIDELGSFYDGNASRYDTCADYVRTLPSCRKPGSAPSGTPGSCKDFVEDRLSYTGCVNKHKNDTDFEDDTWRIFLGKDHQLWRSDNETIVLLDANGKTVDQYSY